MVTRVRKAATKPSSRIECLHCRRLIPYTLPPREKPAPTAPRSADPNRCRENGLDVGIDVGIQSAPKPSRGFSTPSGDLLCRECRQCRQIQKESGYWGECPVGTSRIRNRSNIPKMPTFPTLPTRSSPVRLRSHAAQPMRPCWAAAATSAFSRRCSWTAEGEERHVTT